MTITNANFDKSRFITRILKQENNEIYAFMQRALVATTDDALTNGEFNRTDARNRQLRREGNGPS